MTESLKEYNLYSKEQLIQIIDSLERENKFLKEYIKSTKEFKSLLEGTK